MARGNNPLSVEARWKRSYLLYGFSIVIIVIIGVSMIGGLAPSRIDSSGSSLVFGTYDGQEILFAPTNYFGASYDNYYQYYTTRFPEGVDQSLLLRTIWHGAYSDTVLHTAQLQSALAGGVHVSQQRVDRALVESVATYESLEEMPVTTREGNLKRLRELLVRQRYADDLARGRLSSDNEVAFYEETIKNERRFEFISLSFDTYPDSEVAAYGEANDAGFRRIDLSRIETRGGVDAAEEIRQLILTGTATFEDQARTHSQDGFADQGGDLGFRYFYDLDRDLANSATTERVFSLADGEISEVLEGRSEGVLYLYRADSRVIEPDFTEADTLATVRSYLIDSELGLVEDFVLTQADRFSVATAQSDFRNAAADFDLAVHSTEWFPINYRNLASPRRLAVTGGEPLLAGASELEEFFLQGFSLQRIGDVSAPIRLRDQVIVLSLLDERDVPPEILRSSAGDTVFGWFTAEAIDYDLQWWVNSSGLLEDNFSQAFAAIRSGSGG